MNVVDYNKDPKVNPIVFDDQANVVSAMLSQNTIYRPGDDPLKLARHGQA